MWNTIKTCILLGVLSSLVIGFGALIGGQSGMQTAFIIALIMNGIMYFYSARLVLAMYRAVPLERTRYARVYAMVQELTSSMQLPMPTLWLIQMPMANAFATGRSPSHAAVAVTSGILEILDERELRGVLAHELAHVKNRDVLISTIAATLAATISYAASMLRYAAFFSSSKDRRDSGGIGAFIIALFMPLAAALVQMAISRSREYQADHTGAICCKDPLALASALKKLHDHIPGTQHAAQDARYAGTASLFIVHPFAAGSITELFSTHPPLAERIKRLERLQYTHTYAR